MIYQVLCTTKLFTLAKYKPLTFFRGKENDCKVKFTGRTWQWGTFFYFQCFSCKNKYVLERMTFLQNSKIRVKPNLKKSLKLVSVIFYQNVISHWLIALQKLWKMFFILSKKLFSFSRYSDFCISVFPSFSPCQPLL